MAKVLEVEGVKGSVDLDDYQGDFGLPDWGDLGDLADFQTVGTPKSQFSNLEEFTAYLTERQPKEEVYGYTSHSFLKDITMCRFFESKNNENILADIEQKNKEQNMGNFQIPNTNIKLINFSICPKCGRVFTFKELMDYYANPIPDSEFKSLKTQHREDTRAFCPECKTYFLPALVISDGMPKNEVQFLCRTQTTNAKDFEILSLHLFYFVLPLIC